MPIEAEKNTFPSLCFLISRALFINPQKMDGPNASEKDIKCLFPCYIGFVKWKMLENIEKKRKNLQNEIKK